MMTWLKKLFRRRLKWTYEKDDERANVLVAIAELEDHYYVVQDEGDGTFSCVRMEKAGYPSDVQAGFPTVERAQSYAEKDSQETT